MDEQEQTEMDQSACAAIRELLTRQDVPVAAFIDDHVANAIAQRNILAFSLRKIRETADDGVKEVIDAALEEAFPTPRKLRELGSIETRLLQRSDDRTNDSTNSTVA